MRTPKGHIRRHGSRYEIAVPVGRDPITKRYRYAYDYADSEEQAERRRADLIEQITKGRAPQARATVSDLIDRWLSIAELELITSVNYQSYIERVIRPALGGLQLREIQDRVEVLDELYAQLRRCRRLCGGRPGLVDHRPVGLGRRRPGGEPDHECDQRCVPIGASLHRHRRFTRSTRSCTGRSPSRSSGRWMDRNPADLATRPRAARDDRDPPTPRDAVRLLEAAEAYRPDLTLAIELAYRPGGLLAAKLHLKHISVATTEGYASRPGGAQAEFLAEVNKHEADRNLDLVWAEFRNYQQGIMPAGPGARELTEFFAHVDAGLAPETAEAPKIQRSDREILNLLAKRASTLHRGTANYCWFTDPSRALCLKLAGAPAAGKPLTGMCDSARCPQATHHPCHRPVWADAAAATKTFLDSLGPARKTEKARLQADYARAQRVLAEIDAASGRTVDH